MMWLIYEKSISSKVFFKGSAGSIAYKQVNAFYDDTIVNSATWHMMLNGNKKAVWGTILQYITLTLKAYIYTEMLWKCIDFA